MKASAASRKVFPLLLTLTSALGSPAVTNAASGSAITDGNTAFAFDLYGQFRSTPGNLFFSPYSISTALTMTHAGARGDTEKQMARVLHFGGDQRRVHDGFAEIQRQLAQAGKKKVSN